MEKSSIYIILTFCLLLAIALVVKASPANYLTNPSFTGGITGWTVDYDLQDAGATIGYDSTYYQDTAGSLKGDTAAGKKQDVQGYAKQTVGTAINVSDTVKLQLRWSKRNIVAAAVTHTIKAQICKPGLDCTVAANWTDIWSDTSIPAADGATVWADTGLVDVDSYFDVSGTYQFRWYFLMQSANSTNAQTLAWIDNTSLDVTAPTVTCVFPLSNTNSTTTFPTLNTSSVFTSSPNATNTVSSDVAMQITVYDVGATATNTKPGLYCSGCSGTDDAKTIGSANASYVNTSTLAAGTEGYGLQATTTGSNLIIDPRFLWAPSGNNVGGLEASSTNAIIIASSSAAVSPSELMTIYHRAAVSGTNLAGNYTDQITYTCSAI